MNAVQQKKRPIQLIESAFLLFRALDLYRDR